MYILSQLFKRGGQNNCDEFENFVLENIVKGVFLDEFGQNQEEVFTGWKKRSQLINFDADVITFQYLITYHTQSGPLFSQVRL